jgi:hypothetical protein
MSNPAVDSWWSDWLDAHGRDSDEERAFVGYLTQQGIPSHGDADQLEAAYQDFKAFMAQSQATPSADPGPDAKEAGVEDPIVPKSAVADPEQQRPPDDATHPHQMSSAGAPASPSQQEAARQRHATPAPVMPEPPTPAMPPPPKPSSGERKD